jgi:altronate dehydratase small subunit
MKQRAFIIHASDNVGTALDDLEPGPVTLIGEGAETDLACLEPVRFGHKIALSDLTAGEEVIKSSVVIGKMLVAVKAGQYLHLHNIESQFDERSGTLDNDTGAPTEEDVYR